jgi:DNA repair protein RecO (recombination protein O)
MIQQTRGIVLQRFKYSDSKVIAKIYTEKYGLISCIFYSSTSKKGLMQLNVLQPMYVTDISIYFKESSNFQKVKEIGLNFPVVSISLDIKKNTICLFLAEFILKTLKENEPDPELFRFLVQSTEQLNEQEENVSNFHLIFLMKLSKYLGIMPENNFSESEAIFDLKSGKFITGHPSHSYFLNIHLSAQFSKIFELDLSESEKLSISHQDRNALLNSVIAYYNTHLERPGEVKSLRVLKDVFS